MALGPIDVARAVREDLFPGSVSEAEAAAELVERYRQVRGILRYLCAEDDGGRWPVCFRKMHSYSVVNR